MPERVRSIEKEKYRSYLHKAHEFYNAMKRAEENNEWNAAALNAIHCTISSFDALTAFYLGVRSAGQRHEDVTKLVRQIQIPDTDDKNKQFVEILRFKTLVEYDAEEPSENETRRIILQTTRIYSWTRSHLKAQ